jgi:hypothetical protein
MPIDQKKMLNRQPQKIFLQLLWQSILLALTCVLTLLFLFQSYILIGFLSVGYVQAPVALLNSINDRLQFRGAGLAADAIIYQRGGRVLIEGLRLTDTKSGVLLASIDHLSMQGSSSLSTLRDAFIQLDVEGGQLYKGNIKQQIVLDGVTLRLIVGKNSLELQHLRSRHQLMTLSAVGSWSSAESLNALKRWQQKVLKKPLPDPTPVPDLATTLRSIVVGLDAASQHVLAAEHTHLHINLSTSDQMPSRLTATADFYAGSVTTRHGSFGPLVVRTAGDYDLTSRQYHLQIIGQVDSLRSPQWGIRSEDVLFDWQLSSETNPFSQLNIATGQLYHGLQGVDRSLMSAMVESLEAIDCELLITVENTTTLTANTRINLLKTTADIEFKGTVDPILLVEHKLLKPLASRLPTIEIIKRPYLNGRLRLSDGFTLQKATLRARIEPLRLDDLYVDYADALLATDGVAFVIERALLETSPHHGYVSAHYHAESGDYAVKLEGIFDPNSISSMVGSWWDSIFNIFDFSEIGVSWADFVIRGNHSLRRPKYFNGSVDAQSVAFEGLKINTGHLKVRGTPTFVELFDLYAQHESGGIVAGSIYWQIIPYSGTGPEIYHLLLDAMIDPAVIAPALPPEAARWATAFVVDAPPIVHLEVRQHNPDFNPPADVNSVFIRAASIGPVVFEGIPMDELAFTYYGKGNRSFLRNVRFKLAEGEGTLTLDRWLDANEDPQLRFQFSLDDACRDKALAVARDYIEHNTDAQDAADKSIPAIASVKTADKNLTDSKMTTPARITVKLNAEGPEADPMAHVGNGYFNLKDPNLASIPLLGPISRLFEQTPLGFTSLRLNTMYGDFRLRRDKVFFPQLMIVGSVGEVEAVGTYYIPDQGVDFRLNIHLLGQLIEPPSFIRQITRTINPFPGILEGNLTGTLDEPRWRSAYDPRSWLPFAPAKDN